MSGFQVDRRQALALGLTSAAALAIPSWAHAAEVDEARVDALVKPFMAAFETPGIGVAIVRPNGPDILKGYGVRTLGQAGAIDVHTRFGIASNSKAFTAAALAILVDMRKLAWEDPVVKHLPEFRMHDPAVTAMMTVRDLLVHRSGLPLGAGDLMYFPTSTHAAEDVLGALPHLKPARGFRAGYDYDNILYIVAGLLIERVSGLSWGAVIQRGILDKLGMTDTVTTRFDLKTDNVAGRHARLGPPVRGMGPMGIVQPDESRMIDAAGGINSSVADIAKWLRIQLNQGQLPLGGLWSPAQAKEMWTPQTIVASSDGPTPDNPTRAVMAAYALGWFVQDYRGRRMISHSGGLSGQVTQTAMIPSLGIGVAVFSNTEDSVSQGIRNALLDALTGAPPVDWPAIYVARRDKGQKEALASIQGGVDAAPPGGPSLSLGTYAGRYRDPWYGDVVVSEKGGKLWIDFVPTPVFKSVLDPWGPDAFRTRFAREAGEDAVVTFSVKDGAITGMTMKALSPLADFSYDYHHLDFTPVR